MERRHRNRSRSPTRRRSKERKRAEEPEQQISQDDYFRMNAVFRLWLRKEKERYFDEMSTDRARKHFGSFVRAWNDGRLGSRYYRHADGELSSLAKGVVTRHSWGFASNIDQGQMDSIKDDVRRATGTRQAAPPAGVATAVRARSPGCSTEQDRLEAEERRERERRQRRQERRREKERQELMLDEVAPKETGREAMLARKRALNQIRHGERSLDVDIPDQDIYEAPGESLAALKRERAQKEQRSQRARQARAPRNDERLQEHLEKERSTVEALRAMAEQSRAHGRGMMRGPPLP